MAEPEAALVFTPEPWVEELHRHLTDHGGARVRQVVVDPRVALDESYDVLIVSDRWPALTHAFVADVHALGRTVLGVFDREQPAGRAHLVELGVDALVASDAGPKAVVAALAALPIGASAPVVAPLDSDPPKGRGQILVVGGASGSGRTEVAVHLAHALGAVVVDADDVAPSVGQRVGAPVEPNVRTAIEAAEHGRGSITACIAHAADVAVVAGVPNPRAWTHTRPGEIVRVVEHVARAFGTAVVDIGASLEDVPGSARTRFGVARALVVEADVLVGVAVATPVGVGRFLSWVVEARALAPETPIVAVVNRAPKDSFRRRELFAEIHDIGACSEIVFIGDDPRLATAMWDARLATRGAFARGITQLVDQLGRAS